MPRTCIQNLFVWSFDKNERSIHASTRMQQFFVGAVISTKSFFPLKSQVLLPFTHPGTTNKNL